MTLTTKQFRKARKKYNKLLAECRQWLREEFKHTVFQRYDAFLLYCRNHLPYTPHERAIMQRAIEQEFKDYKNYFKLWR